MKNGWKNLRRDKENGVIAGVCAGLANYFGLEAWRVRIVFVILSLIGTFGIILYLLLWLLLPAKSDVIQY